MGSALDNIVQVTINRQTQAVQRASFGVFAIISEFATSKTTVAFQRHRHYSDLQELTDDGWLSTDNVYKIAQKVFAQNPRPTKIMVGRKDSGDATWTAALSAIQVATQDWYTFTVDSLVLSYQQSAANWAETEKKIYFVDVPDIAKLAWDADFVASNSITVTITVNGVPTVVGPVVFATDHLTTITAVKSAIVTAGFFAILDPTDTNNRTLLIITTSPTATVDAEVTGGVSQPVDTTTYFYVPTSGTVDVAAWANAQNLERTSAWYHPTAQAYPGPGINGVILPKNPGSATWADKTIAGVASYELTSSERTAALNKKANLYLPVAGTDVTQFGTVATGEYIDIMRGIDWLESRLQEDVFSIKINNDKVPYTDGGVQLIEGAVRGVLDEAARKELLKAETIEITVPKVADVSTADKTARLLPDVKFDAELQGAIHKVKIAGIVTV